MDKMGGGGDRDFKKWGDDFEMGGVDTPLRAMLSVLSKTVENENFN